MKSQTKPTPPKKITTTTLPMVRGVDVEQLEELKSRLPVSLSLIVRTGLTALVKMTDDEYANALNEQAAHELRAKGIIK